MARADSITLLGRARELAELVDAVDRALDGAGSVWFVHGEAGIGKTSLATEVVRQAGERGAITAVATSWDHGGAPPFWPWARLLRSIVATHGRALEPATAIETTQLAGTLLGSEPLAESDRLELFDEVVTTLRRIAAEHPVVLLLDDLHAADVATLLLLRFVAQAIADAPIVVIGTYRRAELRARPELGDDAIAHLDDAARLGGSFGLRGLSLPDVGALVTRVLGTSSADVLVDRIHELTKGNPLFVRHLAPTVSALDDVGHVDVPDGIRSALESRLRRVDATERALLRTAALVGLEARRELVVALLPPGFEPDVRRAMAECLATAVALEFVEVDGETIRFAHPLLREVLVDEIEVSERRSLHGRLADLLAEHSAPASPDEVAHHLLRAGTERSIDAAHACAAAADQAVTSLAFEDAIIHLRRGLEALDRAAVPADSWRLRFDLLVALGRACWRAGRRPECDRAFDDAWTVATELDDPEALALAALGGGFAKAFSVAYPNERVERVRTALDLIGTERVPMRSLLLSKLASELVGHPDPSLARDAAVEALSIAREVGDDHCLGEALAAVMVTELGPDRGDRATRADEMLAIARRCNDRAFAVQARFQLVGALVEHGDRAALDAVVADQHREVNELAEPGYLRHDVWFRAMLATVDGDIATAERLIDEGLVAANLADDPDGAIVWGGQLGVIRWMQGRVDELEPLYRDMAASSTEPVWPSILAWLWSRHGLREAARGMLERVGAIGLDAVPLDRHWLLTMATVAEASARVGAMDLATAAHERLLPYQDRMVPIAMGISYWGTVARPLALVELALGRPQAAADRLEVAISRAAQFGALPWMVEAQLDLAELLLDHDLAAERVPGLLAEAEAASARLGLVEFGERATRLAARLGAARPDTLEAHRVGSASSAGVVGSHERAISAPRIRVLGRFACTDVDGNDVAWNSRKARALLKLLVDARGTHVPRDVLSERLWPGAPPTAVTNRLSVAISTVRRALDPRGVHPRSSFVVVDRDTVWLETSLVEVDLDRFLGAASTALRAYERPEPGGSPVELVHGLQRAAALYGGVPFADDPYGDWWSATRDHVRGVFAEVCHATAAVARSAGLDATAADALRVAVDADPFDVRAHQALVQMYRDRGAHGLADLAEERRRSVLGDLVS
ncbi:MAG TPA: AAA family ATPase [Ilumatobacteraceae bacterium]|nr:AAA family ATPase [Ilumatobacteraceae bacterium]